MIDADALSKKLIQTTIFIKDGEVFQRMINDAPTVSAEAIHKPDYSYEAGMVRRLKEALSADRPTGEWVECESNHIEKIYLCSNCKNYEAWGETEKTPYCPNCGAKMGGDDA